MPRRDDIASILVIGSGPIVIGQACEFDYSGTQACRVLTEEGLPRHPGQLQPGHDHDRPRHRGPHLRRAAHARRARRHHRARAPRRPAAHPWGQTALNLTMALFEDGTLARYGVEVIGARPEAIRTAEDRDRFQVRHARDRPRGPRVGLRALPRRGDGHRFGHWLSHHGAPFVHPGGAGTGIAHDTDTFARSPPRGSPPARSPRSSSRSRSPGGRSTSSRSCATRRTTA